MNVPGISLGNHEGMESMSNTDPILKPYKQLEMIFCELCWQETRSTDMIRTDACRP